MWVDPDNAILKLNKFYKQFNKEIFSRNMMNVIPINRSLIIKRILVHVCSFPGKRMNNLMLLIFVLYTSVFYNEIFVVLNNCYKCVWTFLHHRRVVFNYITKWWNHLWVMFLKPLNFHSTVNQNLNHFSLYQFHYMV